MYVRVDMQNVTRPLTYSHVREMDTHVSVSTYPHPPPTRNHHILNVILGNPRFSYFPNQLFFKLPDIEFKGANSSEKGKHVTSLNHLVMGLIDRQNLSFLGDVIVMYWGEWWGVSMGYDNDLHIYIFNIVIQ